MRRFGGRLVLVAIGVLAPLVAVELGLRLFGPFLPGNYNTGSFLTTHPVFGRFHVRAFDGWVKTSEYTSRVTINSLGLRGPERPYAKPAGTFRVLMLGDSFVEAAQVQPEEGVAARLESALASATGARVEVLNAGVGGWGTGQQYVFLKHEGIRYEPDLVLVALYLGNDVYDNGYALQGRPKNPHEPYFLPEADGSLRQLDFRVRKPEDVDPVTAALRFNTLLWNVFETGVLAKFVDEGEDPLELRLNRFNLNKMGVHAVDPNERTREAWDVTLRLIEQIRAFASQHGARTVLVVIPAAWQVYDDQWDDLIQTNKLRPSAWSQDRPNQTLVERRSDINVPVLDLLAALRREAAAGAPALYFSADKHWTAAGHAVAAREIAEFLLGDELVAAPAANR